MDVNGIFGILISDLILIRISDHEIASVCIWTISWFRKNEKVEIVGCDLTNNKCMYVQTENDFLILATIIAGFTTLNTSPEGSWFHG